MTEPILLPVALNRMFGLMAKIFGAGENGIDGPYWAELFSEMMDGHTVEEARDIWFGVTKHPDFRDYL